MAIFGRYRTVFTGVAGTPWYSNMYFDEDQASMGLYGPFIRDFWLAVNPLMHTSVDWQVEPGITYIESTTGLIVDVGTWAGATGSGTDVTEPIPFSNQALVHWDTGEFLAGRQLRGRTFIPGLTQAANDNGQLLAADRTVLQAAATELINDGNGAMLVWSRTHNQVQPVSGASVPLLIAVLRSRRD